MLMTKDTRAKVTLNPDAFKVLEVEAMLQGLSLKDAASKLIIKAACPKCKEILDIMARPPKEPKDTKGPSTTTPEIVPKVQMAQEPKGQRAQVPYSPRAQKTKLSQDKIALAKIAELWGSGNRNREQIAKEIGYAKSTTSENIRAMIKKGDLK